MYRLIDSIARGSPKTRALTTLKRLTACGFTLLKRKTVILLELDKDKVSWASKKLQAMKRILCFLSNQATKSLSWYYPDVIFSSINVFRSIYV